MKKISIFAPNEQQIEGLKWVLDVVSFWVFVNAVTMLTIHKMISKSRRHLLIKRARHILGIPLGKKVSAFDNRVGR